MGAEFFPSGLALYHAGSIPKMRAPKDIDDYCRISLSNSIYKIYAALSLMKGIYRFIRQVSCEIARQMIAYIYFAASDGGTLAQRIVDLYVLSIELEAFDTVWLDVISEILRAYAVPCRLINRIITAILHELCSLAWSNDKFV